MGYELHSLKKNNQIWQWWSQKSCHERKFLNPMLWKIQADTGTLLTTVILEEWCKLTFKLHCTKREYTPWDLEEFTMDMGN